MVNFFKTFHIFDKIHLYYLHSLSIVSSCFVFYPIIVLCIITTACVSPSLMLKTPKDFNFSTLDSLKTDSDYVITVNDKIRMQIFSANGLSYLDNLIASTNGQGSNSTMLGNNTGPEYLIEYDSTIKLPIFKNVKLAGLTIREAERYLERLYSQYYENPFVILNVTNNRVIIFPGGEGGTAKVLTLENTNTSLFEALAMVGGISDGRSKDIKLIRGDYSNPEIYKINLSKISGLKDGMVILKAGDIIYVTPRDRTASQIINEITPWLTLLTTTISVVTLFISILKK